MRSTRLTLIGTAAALALALTACGSDDKDDPKDDAKGLPTASAAGTPSASDAPSGSSSPTADDDESATGKPPAAPVDPAQYPAAKPGTQVKVGQPAVVPYEDDDKKGALQVTVTAIEKGSIEDLTAANIKVEDKDKSSVPYYVRVTYKNVSAADFSNSLPQVELSALDPSGRDLGSTMVFGAFDKCESPDTDGFTNGAETSGCEMYLAPAGSSVASVSFDFPEYDQKPVVWKP